MKNIKKILFTGIILVLVTMFAVTCDNAPAGSEVEYTDVVYSPNGSEITLYLDGVGVPVTPGQRAINRELATMAYDFFEVIFIGATGGTADIARTSWELGQPAGIANVPRGTKGTGIDYKYDSGKSASTSRGIACMFVGKKSDKTLLGIGFITKATPYPAAVTTAVDSATGSVTFSIAAIQTGLLAWNPTLNSGAGAMETIATVPGGGVVADSFKYVAVTTAGGSGADVYPVNADGYGTIDNTNSTRSEVNGSTLKYPRYLLPPTGGTVYATYDFSHITANTTSTDYLKFAKVINSDSDTIVSGHPLAQKRVPRFMVGGRYMEPKEAWTTTTTVRFWKPGMDTAVGDYRSSNTSLHDSDFNTKIGLRFDVNGSGIFSFYLEIPVYMLNKTQATFDSSKVDAQKWYIRTGVGSELYSLDDGIANGGCVFMSVGGSSANWLDIEWQWL